MKKLAIAMMLSVSALAASAQVNYKVQTACHPQDVKHYDTERLRSSFMMEKVMAPDEINVTYKQARRITCRLKGPRSFLSSFWVCYKNNFGYKCIYIIIFI